MLSKLRENNIQIMMYIDDALIVQSTFDECLQATRDTLKLMQDLGFNISWEKCTLIPTHKIKYLGFVIDSEEMSIRPLEEKIEDIKNQCKSIRERNRISIRDLAQLIGKLIALTPGNKYGYLFCKRLENYKNKWLKKNLGDYNSLIILAEEIIEDIKWWENNAGSFPVSLRMLENVLVITSDASTSGWAGVCEGETINGLWSDEEQSMHINLLEIKAAFLSIKTFAEGKKKVLIKLYSDNQCTVLCINKQGSTKNKINELIRSTWLFCKENTLELVAIHVPSEQNVADEGSRRKGLETEWSLRDHEYQIIENKFGPFDADLFASRINKKVDRYVSWHKDCDAWRIDAFSFLWSDIYSYIFPPFSMILKTLHKVQVDKAECIIIVPWWKSQVWVPKLMTLLADYPVLLPKDKHILEHPMKETHPILKKSRLIACRLSGHSYKNREFQRKLRTQLCPPGEKEHETNMNQYLNNGLFFVVNGMKAPFQNLLDSY